LKQERIWDDIHVLFDMNVEHCREFLWGRIHDVTAGENKFVGEKVKPDTWRDTWSTDMLYENFS